MVGRFVISAVSAMSILFAAKLVLAAVGDSVIASLLLRNRCAIAAQSHRNLFVSSFVIAAEYLRNRFAITLKSLRNRCAIATRSHRNLFVSSFVIAAECLRNRSAIALKSLRNR
jgi:hypothetical protein